MSYRPGYKFTVHESRGPEPERKPLPILLYDIRWDPAENMERRKVTMRLQDGAVVECVKYRNGAVYVENENAHGWLG